VALATDALPATLSAWLQRRGRLANPHADTNTLGAIDDHAAVAAFLRERAARSRHTWRAYLAELQRLALWCHSRGRGPLSDLTRQDLLAYRHALGQPVIEAGAMASDQTRRTSALSQRSQARALAVVASLFGHWHDTGYLLGNPAAGLVGGARACAGFTPKGFVPAPLLQACDAWAVRSTPAAPSAEALRRWRQVAVWTVFRFAGIRLSELAWAADAGLPRLDIDERGGWTLRVLGKGDKERAIPLTRSCAQVLRDYRQARGLPALPGALERAPLIHGEKGSALVARCLYDEVKAVLFAVADKLEPGDAAGAQLLRVVSPHWLRHAYARTLGVDKGVPLPAAQVLLGQVSVRTTAEYAETDLSKLREFVEQGFGDGDARSSSANL
jgi:site-specific recombinase XerD